MLKGIRKGNRKSHGVRCYAAGGRVANDIGEPGDVMGAMSAVVEDDESMVEGVPARTRMDRSPRKQAPVNVNVVVNSNKSANDSPQAPMAPPVPAPVPEMPMRKHGGRVCMKDGAGGGLGRLEKAKDAKK